jgi:hypothetical protein
LVNTCGQKEIGYTFDNRGKEKGAVPITGTAPLEKRENFTAYLMASR